MTDQEIRQDWLEFWGDAGRAFERSKASPGALLALSDHYRQLDPHARLIVDLLLADELASPDENVRFDVLSLIDGFEIRTALPHLRQLEARLAGEPAPGPPYEANKVHRIIGRLGAVHDG